MRIEARLDPTQLNDTLGFLLALPGEINLAKTRTLRKTVKWAGTQLARKLATENNMPVSIFKTGVNNRAGFRVRTNTIKNGGTFGQVWTGFKQVKAAYIGKPTQKKTGASAGRRRTYKGAFVATMKSGHTGIYERIGKSALPIREITEEVKTVSTDEIGNQVQPELYKQMNAELNYILRVRRS